MANIQIDFQRARRLAQQIEEEADRLRSLANQTVQNVIDCLNGQWEGESASAFLKKCLQMKEKMLGEAKHLDQTAALIRGRIELMYRAEQLAKEIATTRQGG